MKLSLFITLPLLMLVSVSQAAERRLNVLIIYADDLGFGDLQCYNPDSKNSDTESQRTRRFWNEVH